MCGVRTVYCVFAVCSAQCVCVCVQCGKVAHSTELAKCAKNGITQTHCKQRRKIHTHTHIDTQTLSSKLFCRQ